MFGVQLPDMAHRFFAIVRHTFVNLAVYSAFTGLQSLLQTTCTHVSVRFFKLARNSHPVIFINYGLGVWINVCPRISQSDFSTNNKCPTKKNIN